MLGKPFVFGAMESKAMISAGATEAHLAQLAGIPPTHTEGPPATQNPSGKPAAKKPAKKGAK